MSFEIVTVPCLSDNYAFLIHGSGKTALVDAPDTRAIEQALAKRGWQLDEIWVTHHHDDHIQGVDALRGQALVRGAKADAHRLPRLDVAHSDGDSFEFAGASVSVMDVSGHTIGHIAFVMESAAAAFTGDSLMALGCGRLFEGTYDQMWASLSALAALSPQTQLYSGHEYTEANGRFAVTIEPDNPALKSRIAAIKEARAIGKPTVPSLLADELNTNPFLRAGLAEVKSILTMEDATDAAVFGEIRRRKDLF